MQSNERGGPAFPFIDSASPLAHPGMTLRQYAAIKLKVPDSGTEWLDAMIEKSLRDDFAAKAMQGMLANQHPYQASDEHMFARDSYTMADAMLEARKGGAA